MTNSNLDRLDRLEALAETILLAIDQLRQRQEASQQQIELQQREIRDLATETVQWFADVVNQAKEDRAYMRGLQIENRRILDRLERHTADGHGGS